MAAPLTTETHGGDVGYRDVLRLPYAGRAFAAGLLGRMAFASVSLALLVTVEQATGSYAMAGAAVAGFGLTGVVLAPRRARMVDRLGQRAALTWLATAHASSLAVVVVLASVPVVHGWILVGAATLAGASPPPLGASMRRVWASLAPDESARVRAYALDSVGEELVYVSGPLLVALVLIVAPPAAAIGISALLCLTGAIAMARSPAALPAAARASRGG